MNSSGGCDISALNARETGAMVTNTTNPWRGETTTRNESLRGAPNTPIP